jgi:hypothetical protein
VQGRERNQPAFCGSFQDKTKAITIFQNAFFNLRNIFSAITPHEGFDNV